jgi:hypothetical protein
MTHTLPIQPSTPLKQRLLTGASAAVIVLALSVVVPSGVQAQVDIISDDSTTPTALAATNDIQSDNDDNGADFGAIDTDGGVAYPSITLTDPDTIFVFDGTPSDEAATIANDFVIDGSVDSGGTDDPADITASVIFGASASDTPAGGAVLTVTGDLEGDSDTRGDSLNVGILAGGGAASDSTLNVGGNTNMTAITVGAGNGDDTADGGALDANFGDDSAGADTFDVTTFSVNGGNGASDADNDGGDTTAAIQADTLISTLTVQGGRRRQRRRHR